MTDDNDYDKDGGLRDDTGDPTSPGHAAISAAVESAGDNEPHGGTAGGDDEDNDNDSGDDVDESSADDDALKATQPKNIFQRYASTPDARQAAEQFTPKRFDSPGGNTTHPNQFGERLSGIAPEFNATTDQADNAVRIVGGDSQVLDGNALRAVEAAISEATRANFDTSALQQQATAIRSNVLNVRAAAPVMVPLMPLAKTPTPVE